MRRIARSHTFGKRVAGWTPHNRSRPGRDALLRTPDRACDGGQGADEIADLIQAALRHRLTPQEGSHDYSLHLVCTQHLGPGMGAWHPHFMVFAPYYENSMVGGNEFGTRLPPVSDDAGTPFTVVVIPVDDKRFVKPERKQALPSQ
jgi:hypothetical protein